MHAVREEEAARAAGAPREQTAAPARRGRVRRIIAWSAAALFVYLAVEAVALPPARQPSAYVVVGAIRAYQSALSPAVGKVVRCKFQPSCSHYGAQAVEKHGTVAGTLNTCGRIWRCSPWGPPPGEDLP